MSEGLRDSRPIDVIEVTCSTVIAPVVSQNLVVAIAIGICRVKLVARKTQLL
jgi:hypothetical protein